MAQPKYDVLMGSLTQDGTVVTCGLHLAGTDFEGLRFLKFDLKDFPKISVHNPRSALASSIRERLEAGEIDKADLIDIDLTDPSP